MAEAKTGWYVSTCPETGRVFVVLYGEDDNMAEVFAHVGLSAAENAEKIAKALNVVTEIVPLLDGTEWNSETICDVANILRDEGFTVRDLDDEGDGFEEAVSEVIRATKAHGGNNGE